MAHRWWLILLVLAAASCRRPIAENVVETSGTQSESTAEDGEPAATGVSERVDDTEVLKPDPEAYHPEVTPDRTKAETRIVASTNHLRVGKKLANLEVNPALQKTAASFADYMARTSRYGHYADGRDAAERVKKYEYKPCLVDENIAYAFRSRGFSTEELATDFFEGWKKSPGHLKNMLDPDVTQTAVAIAEGEGGYFFAVQLFGRPDSEMIGVELTNHANAEFEYKMGDDTFKLLPRQTRTHQACRPQHLEFRWIQSEDSEQTISPQPGDHYTVTFADARFHVQKK